MTIIAGVEGNYFHQDTLALKGNKRFAIVAAYAVDCAEPDIPSLVLGDAENLCITFNFGKGLPVISHE